MRAALSKEIHRIHYCCESVLQFPLIVSEAAHEQKEYGNNTADILKSAQ